MSKIIGVTVGTNMNPEKIKGSGGGGGNGYDNFYNVKDYGAVGDGVTDDVVAIQAAVTAAYNAGGGTVYIPQGEYVVKSPILWESNVSLVGDGIGRSVIKSVSDTAVLGFSVIHYDTAKYGANNRVKNCTFSDFEIDGSGLQVSVVSWRGKGIFLIGVENCIFRDICIRETAATGLGIDALKNVTISGVMCINCGRTWVKPANEQNLGCAGIGIGTNMINDEYFTITGCMTKGCGNMGIFLEDQTANGNLITQYALIANNIVLDGLNVGIGIRGTKKVIVSDNIISGNVYGVEFSRENKNILVNGNQITNNGYGIYDNSISDESIDITNNVIENNAIAGVYYINTTTLGTGTKDGILLKGNKVKNNVKGFDITGDIANLSIVENFIEHNTDTGILVNEATLSDCYALRNIFKGNGADHTGLLDSLAEDSVTDLTTATLTGIELNESAVSIAIAGTEMLSVRAVPSNALLGTVTWNSNAPAIAKVENGLITGLSEGNAIITATCDGFTATCVVSVFDNGDMVVPLNSVESENGYYGDDGTFTTSASHITSDFIAVGERNLFNCDSDYILSVFDENKVFLGRSGSTPINANRGRFLPVGTKYIRVRIQPSANYSATTVTIVAKENVYDSTSELLSAFVNASGVLESRQDQLVTEMYLAVEPSTTYDLGCWGNKTSGSMTLKLSEFNAGKEFISRTNSVTGSFTTSATTAYIRLGFGTPNGSSAATTEQIEWLKHATYIFKKE